MKKEEIILNVPAVGEEEIWKVIPDYPCYEASSFGRIRNIKTQKILTPRALRNGYLQVHLRSGVEKSNGKYINVHTLVAYTFLGPRPEGLSIDHLDRNRENNYYKNLRYATFEENNKNRSSRMRPRLTNNVPIVLISREGEFVARYANCAEAAKVLNISIKTIRGSVHGFHQMLAIGNFMREIDFKQEKNI